MHASDHDTRQIEADLAAALAEVLRGDPALSHLADAAFAPVGRTGVSHLHLAAEGAQIGGRPVIARIPLLSQWGLAPAEALAYEAACFARAAPSGRTPRLHAVLPITGGLPFGALIVDRIQGAKPRLSGTMRAGDMGAIARCLAALHGLPVPTEASRPPLKVQADAVTDTLAVIREQAAYLDRARVEPAARARLRAELDRLEELPVATGGLPPVLAFVGTDTHPGNFFIRQAGDAVFLDLEKAMYGNPAIDLAHASLYTSTMWDPDVATALDAAATRDFYDAYRGAAPPALAEAVRAWATPMRRLTWLRTTTWAARWTVLSAETGSAWQGAHMPEAVRAHMERTVADYLSVATLERVAATVDAV